MSTDPTKPPESDEKRQHALGSRPFTILDSMVLIASTALGFVTMRLYAVPLLQFELSALPTFPRLWLTAYRYIVVVMPLTLTWSFAGFLLAFRRPRSPLRRLIRQPGFVACGAVSVVIAIRVTGYLTLWLRGVYRNVGVFGMDYWQAFTIPFSRLGRGPILVFADYAGPYFSTTAFGVTTAVAAAWSLLYLSGRWRSDPGWLDRMGRLLGLFWLAITPFSCWWDYYVLGL